MTRVDLARLSDVASGVPSGSSFPGSPATNSIFFRTDKGLFCFYDGTRWLSVQLFEFATSYFGAGQTASIVAGNFAPLGVATNLWFVDLRWAYFVSTTHSGTQYWTLQLYDTNVGLIGPLLTSDKATANASVNPTPTAIGSAFPAFSSDMIQFQLTKVSTPGAIQFSAVLRYRLIIT